MTSPRSVVVLDGRFAICRLGPDADVPAWATAGPFHSITRTADELSVVCGEAVVPNGIRVERGWRALRVAGTLDFRLVGVLAALTGPLAEAVISVFAVATFDTDYFLVRDLDLERAFTALEVSGRFVVDRAQSRR